MRSEDKRNLPTCAPINFGPSCYFCIAAYYAPIILENDFKRVVIIYNVIGKFNHPIFMEFLEKSFSNYLKKMKEYLLLSND